jgi:hypothetical protein
VKHQRSTREISVQEFELIKSDYQKWTPIFNRLGLKPRKFLNGPNELYVGTAEGWFRLSLIKYDKQELKWLRSILEYLETRSFNNWALPWQKTIIWEESNFCYLIQPWLFDGDYFTANDPASITRVAEILADFFRCGKDYHESKGIRICRDRWSMIEPEWELALQKFDQFKGDSYHEKIRPELNELRKEAQAALNDSLIGWKSSNISSLMEHHRQAGVIGHGNLLAKHIIWCGNDYYLLNWEHLAFQPRIADLAMLITDVAVWEPDWIIFLISEYSKIQPFWPEEYSALLMLLRYPKGVINLLEEAKAEEFDRKKIKEVAKEMVKKERCLTKVWRELGSQKRWAWSKEENNSITDSGRISMVLSPVESWGDFTGSVDSLIQVKSEQKLPSDVIERLTFSDRERVVGGRDGNILEAALENTPLNEFEEIVEEQIKPPLEKLIPFRDETNQEEAIVEITPEKTKTNQSSATILNWSGFLKPVKEGK